MVRKCGGILTKGRVVDLDRPDIPIRVLLSDRLHFYIGDFEVDRKQFDVRKVGERPFFSPISLHPRYARTLVNLTRVRPGQTILDPFCGTGGILLEASMIGAKVLGSDIAEGMVVGCVANLNHFHAHFERIDVSDIGDIASVFLTNSVAPVRIAVIHVQSMTASGMPVTSSFRINRPVMYGSPRL